MAVPKKGKGWHGERIRHSYAKKKGMGTYKFRDLDTKKNITVKANTPTEAIMKMDKQEKKSVNYTFLGFKKKGSFLKYEPMKRGKK